MKLIGSRTEAQIRETLVESNLGLQQGTFRLATVLRRENVDLSCANTIHWIPDQGENFYHVAISETEVLVIEIPHGENEVMANRQPLKNCLHHKSKIDKLKIAMLWT